MGINEFDRKLLEMKYGRFSSRSYDAMCVCGCVSGLNLESIQSKVLKNRKIKKQWLLDKKK